MSSLRAGQTLVRLIRARANAQQPGRYCYWLGLALAMALAVGSGVTLARMFGDLSSTTLTVVPAASYERVPLAPESIVSAFGANLANQSMAATDADPDTPGIQLPKNLVGTTVKVNGRQAGLLYVSPPQINFVVPEGINEGPASIEIKSADGTSSTGTVQIAQAAPAIFTANTYGSGVPAALILRAKGAEQTYDVAFQQVAGSFIPKPIAVWGEDETIYLILFASGIRNVPNPLDNIQVKIGADTCKPEYAGPSVGYVGLDQINVPLPRGYSGRGVVKVSVMAGGASSRAVDIEMAGESTANPPQINSNYGSQTFLAGEQMTIRGSGFSPIATENVVRIGSLQAQVVNATVTSLTILVPYGVANQPISVTNQNGQGVSANVLPVQTSFSGLIEDTAGHPLANVPVTVSGLGAPVTRFTDNEGHFVLPLTEPGAYSFEADTAVYTDPPIPKYIPKVTAAANRDNNLGNIALQGVTGSSGTVGSSGSGSSFSGASSRGRNVVQGTFGPDPVKIVTVEEEKRNNVTYTFKYTLDILGSTTAKFPDNRTSGDIFLTPIENSRTPVDLPFGYFSSSIVQITPFGVELDPGAKLTFPNKDGLKAGDPVTLFRYDQNEGRFVEDSAKVFVSADGSKIETEQGAIKTTSYYFAAKLGRVTTIIGRVFEKDGKTPVVNGLARYAGREAYTDSTGSYSLRYVPVNEGDKISVDVSVVRPNGSKSRVDRAVSGTVIAAVGATTKAPDLILPPPANRPPTIVGPKKLDVDEGKLKEYKIIVTDPDGDTSLDLKLQNPPAFASVNKFGVGPGSFYNLKLAPNFEQQSTYILQMVATDNRTDNSVTTQQIIVTVKNVNRAPSASNQSVAMDEDKTLSITLGASDPDRESLKFSIVAQPLNGALSSVSSNLVTYKPNANFSGTDRFTFKANDGAADSNLATVTINVRPVNDAPLLTLPGPQAVNEGQAINLPIMASDPDIGQKLILTATGLPEGAKLITSPAPAQFQWTPTFGQAGTYKVVFNVVDDATPSLSDTKELQIVINDVPLFAAPGPKKVKEGQPLTFDVLAAGGLPVPVTLSATNLPTGASFQNSEANKLQFRWTPGFTQAGNYLVNIRATVPLQPGVVETRQMQISVLDAQHDFAEEQADLTVVGTSDALPPSRGSNAGASVAIADLDGDGIDDLVIGAPSDNDVGQVHIFLGRSNRKGAIDLATQPADLTIRGEALGDLFGASLAAGDINGDGRTDLIIGAPLADASPNAPDSGKVYAIFGALAPGSYNITRIANLMVVGAARGDHLGASVAVGKIAGASAPLGLIIGAPLFDVPTATAPMADAGCVYGFFGGAALAGVKNLGDPGVPGASSADFTITGVIAGGQFGASLATGNFNADDLADMAIGAPAADTGLLKAAGIVYLVPGSQSLSGTIMAVQASALSFNGADSGDGAGSSVALADLNADGLADWIIGAPGADGPDNARTGAGEVYVLFGMPAIQGTPSQLTIYGGSSKTDTFPDGLGTSVAAGDFTGDGTPDLIMGAPGADTGASTRQGVGAAYMIFGSQSFVAGTFDLLSDTPDLKIFGAKPGDRLGSGGFAFGSGPIQCAIGVPEASKGDNAASGSSGAGEVRILRGVVR